MNVQLLELIPSRQSQAGKTIPPKVKLSNGVEAAIGRGVVPNSLQVGAWGAATVTSKQNGQYTNHTLEAWVPQMPPGETNAPFPTAEQRTAAKTDQSVWDAKDRSMAMMASNKPAAEIVTALIGAGAIKDLASAEAAYDSLSKQGYELVILARQDRVATSVNPFRGGVMTPEELAEAFSE